MTAHGRVVLPVAVVVLLLLAGVVQVRLDASRPMDDAAGGELYVRSWRVLDRLSLSYDALVADVYWMRVIQHFGGVRRSPTVEKRYDLLYPLLDLTTSLDPYFTAAYWFGAFFLAEPLPGGAGRPDQAIELLKKGLQHQPDSWRFPQQIGFIEYWYRRDFDRAAEWFHRAAALPGAPEWLTALEATTRAERGDLEASRQIWQQIIETAESDWMRETARFRLLQVETFAAVDQLEGLVTRFKETQGHLPTSWTDLIRAGLLPGIPLDPTGVPFQLDASGRVTPSAESRLYPLPDRMVPGAR